MNKDSWEIKMIGEVFDLYMGRTPSRSNPMYWGDNTGYKWVSISDIGNEKYIQTTKEFISELGKKESKIKVVPKGTVIMSFKLSIGKVAITTEDMYTNEAIMAFHPINSNIFEKNYIYYYLKGYDWIGSNRAVMGTTLNKFSISNSKIVIPPLPIQEQIVKELDTLSDIITKKKEQLAELDKLAQATFYDMFGDPVKNERNWSTKILNEIAPAIASKDNITPINNKYLLLNLDMIESDTGYITNYKYVSLSEIGNSTYKFDTTNLLYSKLRPYLNKVVNPTMSGYATTELVPLKPDIKYLNKVFLSSLLRSKSFVNYIKDKVTGTKMPRTDMNTFKNFSLIVPPLSLQSQFVKKVENIEQQKELINQSITDVQLLFDYTMDKYFN